MTSEAVIMGHIIHFYFDNTFVLFMKETDKEQPYMSLKVDNTDILVPVTEREFLRASSYNSTCSYFN